MFLGVSSWPETPNCNPQKLQAPSSKLQKSSKSQAPKRASQPIQNEQIKNARMLATSGNFPILNFAFLILLSSLCFFSSHALECHRPSASRPNHRRCHCCVCCNRALSGVDCE